MTSHPVVQALAIGGGAAAVASAAAVAGAWAGGALLGAIAAGLILAACYAWRPVDGLVAFGLTILLADTVQHWTVADLRYLDEAAVPLLVATALLVHRRSLSIPAFGWREGALLALVASGVASSVMAEVPASVWIPALALLVKGFGFFYLVGAMPIDAAAVRRISGAVFFVGLVIVAIGVLQFLAPEFAASTFGLPQFEQRRGSIDVVTSVFTHPAIYGWLTVFLALFVFARGTMGQGRWALPLALLLGAASLLSGRRTPIVGLLVGVVTAVARQLSGGRARLRTLAMAAGLVAVVAAVAIPFLGAFYRWTLVEYIEPPELIAEVFSESPDSEALAAMAPRNALYLGAAAIARDRAPLGAGLGRFGSHMSRESYSPMYEAYGIDRVYGLGPDSPIAVTDTFWPMILGETGAIGLLAAVAFFALLGGSLWRAAAMPLPPPVAAFVLGALLVYVESLVRSLTSPIFVAPPIAYFAFGAAGLSLAAVRTCAQQTERRASGGRHLDQSHLRDAVDGSDQVESVQADRAVHGHEHHRLTSG